MSLAVNPWSAPAPKPFAWYYKPLEWLLLGLAWLPRVLLYALAEGMYLLLAYGLRYRWRVVQENLRNSFPEKSEEERKRIGRAFYRHFAQVVVEILMLASISSRQLARRVRFVGADWLDKPFAKNQTVLTLGSHMGNWEWILSGAAVHFPGRADGVYKPLSNPFFEQFMLRLRSRSGARLVPMLATLRYLLSNRGRGTTLSLLTDQAAGPEDHPYWTTFLNQDTGFYTSADRLAQQLGCAVVYVGVRRVRRGYYEVTLKPLYDGEAPLPKGSTALTEAFARHLEQDIRATPEQYLWTHRRWKHKR